MADLFDLPPLDEIKPKRADKAPAAVKVPRGKLKDGVEGIYGIVGMVVSVWCMECGKTIVENGEQRAEEWLAWADSSPQVRRILEMATTGTVAGAVLVGNAAMLIPILSHHGIISGKGAFIAGAATGQIKAEDLGISEEQLEELLKEQAATQTNESPDGI